MRIRKRNRRGSGWKSEGRIVPIDDKDNITLSEERRPTLFMQPKSRGKGDCHVATNP